MSVHPPSSDAPVSKFGRAILLGLTLFLIGGFLVALSVSPDPRGYGTHQQLGLPACTFRMIFGIPCAGCGMTTSFAHFVRGHFVAAAQANPAGVVLATVCVLMIPWCFFSACTGRLWLVSDPVTVGGGLTLSLCMVTVVLWMVRLSGLIGH
jgi:hypothetical protein